METNKLVNHKGVKVVAILEHLSDEEQVHRVKKFCLEKNVQFSTRLYRPNKSEDATQITQLPAFHIYVKNGYTKTFYLDSHPYKHIRDGIDLLTQKKVTWINLYHNFKKSVGKLFNRNLQ